MLKLGSILFTRHHGGVCAGLGSPRPLRRALAPLLLAAVTYCRMVREYTKDLGPFYTGWVSPNARRK
jgi:hypothetical protein